MGNNAAGYDEGRVRGGMRAYDSRKRFWNRAVEIVCQSPALRSLFDVGRQGSDSPHPVQAEVGPVIKSAL
jgi:hypothetical protein